MLRVSLALIGVFVSAGLAAAQPSMSLSTVSVAPGASVTVTVDGTAGAQYAVIGSTVGSGFSYAGVNLSVGTDVAILSVGVIPGSGSAAVAVTPQFNAREQYFLQAVTSTDGFASISATNGTPVMLRDTLRVFQAIGGGVNPNGAGFALSPGVAVSRTGAGTYLVTFGNNFTGGTNQIPNITSFCGSSPTGITANNAQFTVNFAADCGFFFTVSPIRR